MALDLSDRLRGQRVRAVREGRGEDQATFARHLAAAGLALKYDAALVSKIENGRRRINYMKKPRRVARGPDTGGINP